MDPRSYEPQLNSFRLDLDDEFWSTDPLLWLQKNFTNIAHNLQMYKNDKLTLKQWLTAPPPPTPPSSPANFQHL